MAQPVEGNRIHSFVSGVRRVPVKPFENKGYKLGDLETVKSLLRNEIHDVKCIQVEIPVKESSILQQVVKYGIISLNPQDDPRHRIDIAVLSFRRQRTE